MKLYSKGMRKLVRARDYLLLTLGIVGDTIEEFKDPFSIQEKGHQSLFGYVPYRWQKHNFQRTVYGMLKTGDIEKVIIKGKPVIRLSSQGKEKWVREFPLFSFSQKTWDGWWRIVSFDIPDNLKGRRDSLRNKIERLGMGKLQESLYISPFDFGLDLREFIEFHKLADYVFVFEARHTFGGDPKDLAWRVWQLESIENKYKLLLSAIEGNKPLSSQERFDLQMKFEETILNDPLLPKELLPNDWIGFKAQKLFITYTT